MRIALLYIAVSGAETTDEFCARFVGTQNAFPAGIEHDTIVICNGGTLPEQTALLFASVPRSGFFPRSNDGWDIGGYMQAARGPASDYDMVVCCGESVYFQREGWLNRLVEAWERHGPGMYGVFSSYAVQAHMNTTAFATSPKLLRSYPIPVVSRKDRYEFEHGSKSFWRILALMGKPSMLVTWDGIWKPQEWRFPKNILWRGDQSNMLMRCNHADRFDAAHWITKARWQYASDNVFK